MIKPKKEGLLVKPIEVLPSSRDFRVMGVTNPAAVRMKNGNIMLFVRVIERLIEPQNKTHFYSPRMTGKKEYKRVLDKFPKKKIKTSTDLDFSFKDDTKRLTFISHFRKVILEKDGFTIKEFSSKPNFFGTAKDGELGVEDPRIVKIREKYFMTYVALSRDDNVSTAFSTSENLKSWKRRGIIFSEQNKDVVIFPEKINGKYYAINRPESTFQFSSPHMWMVESENLNHWDEPDSLILSRGGWDSGRVGAGPPPLKTKYGWLLVYHGVTEKNKRLTYSAGAALLQLNNPRKIIAKTPSPIILPKKEYERGDFEKKDVVFPTGMIWHENMEDVLIYSGGGDINTTVRQISLKDILNSMRKVRNA